MRLTLFRHGETDWNREGRCQGHLDIPLNDNGRAQAVALAASLAGRDIETVLSSDLSRAADTGRMVAERLGVPIAYDARLRETHLGIAQGHTFAEIGKMFGPDLLEFWHGEAPADADLAFPEGETSADVTGRALAAMAELAAASRWRHVAISTHGGVMRRLMGLLAPAGAQFRPIGNTAVIDAVWNPATGRPDIDITGFLRAA